jgi:hypothetical protein
MRLAGSADAIEAARLSTRLGRFARALQGSPNGGRRWKR